MSGLSALIAVSGLLVFAVAAFLLLQGIVALCWPQRVRAFLDAFASSARAHFTELALRIVAGLGFVGFAPWSAWPWLFELFGWVLLLTSLVLLGVPWRLHRRFAQWAVPMATRRMLPYALGCLVGAAGIGYGLAFGSLLDWLRA